MKYIILLFVSLVFTSIVHSQTKTDSVAAVKLMNTLINLSKAGEHGKAAGLVLYTGADKARAYKMVSDYTKKEDRDRVDNLCIDIKKLIIDSKSRMNSGSYSEQDEYGTWQVIEMTCTYDDNKTKQLKLYFLKINGKFLFEAIDD